MMIMGTLSYGEVTVAGNTIENVDEFCYLGSIIQDDSSCERISELDWVKPVVFLGDKDMEG